MQTQSSRSGILRQSLSTAGRGQAEPRAGTAALCGSAGQPLLQDLTGGIGFYLCIGRGRSWAPVSAEENKALPAAGAALQPAWCCAGRGLQEGAAPSCPAQHLGDFSREMLNLLHRCLT